MVAAPVMPILFGGLIAWSLYRRVRRNIGRQRLHPGRIVFSLVIFSIIAVALVAVSVQSVHLLLGIGGGLLLGVILGFVGLRLTRFETSEQGYFYTPNTHIGLALSLLFVGRMLYRLWVFRDGVMPAGSPAAMQSPLTYFILGLVVGYYLVYYGGLFIHARSKK
jgi:hypothetical protein